MQNRVAIGLDKALALLVAIALLGCVLLYRPWPWDTTAYHLPFAARALDISKYANISMLLNHRYEGFPILWRYALAPGLALNVPRLYLLPNFLATLAIAYSSVAVLAVPWYWGIAATICFPISLIGLASSYQDYFTNTFILAGSLMLFRGIHEIVRVHSSGLIRVHKLIIGLVFLSVAANTKFQGLFMSIVALLIALLYYFILAKYSPQSREQKQALIYSIPVERKMVHLVMFIAIVYSIFFQPLSNIARFGNPVYPFKAFGLSGAEKTYTTPLEYLPKAPLAYNVISHFLSSTEIDPYILPGGSSKPPEIRTIDMHNGNRSAPSSGGSAPRTGGTIGPIYISLLALSLLSLSNVIRNMYSDLRFESHLPLLLFFMLIGISALPQSLELRYYLVCLYIPAYIALCIPRNQVLGSIAKAVVCLGIIAGIMHIGFLARSAIISTTIFDLRKELPSQQECIAMGSLLVEGSSGKTLVLDPDKVNNNVPFKCRMTLDKNVFIKYGK